MRRAALAGLLALAAATVLACGGGDGAPDLERGTSTNSTILSLYAALPLDGPDAPRSREAIDGMKLALRDSGGKAGELRLNFRAVDTTGRDGEADPESAAAAGRDIAEDRSAIAVVGGLDPEATAILLPILNSASVLLVSPASTYVGFTQRAGAGKGEPERYFPSARPSFVRLAPNDALQARELRAAARRDGCRRQAVFAGRDPFDDALARILERDPIGRSGPDVESFELDGERDPADLRREVVERLGADALRGVDCAFVSSGDDAGAAALVRALHAVDPRLRVYVPDGLATGAFERSLAGAADVVTQTRIGVPPSTLRRTAQGRRFAASFRRVFGRSPGPLAAPGYEAMRTVIDAIRAGGEEGNDRRVVRDHVFGTRRQASLLGPFAVDRRTGASTVRDLTIVRLGRAT